MIRPRLKNSDAMLCKLSHNPPADDGADTMDERRDEVLTSADPRGEGLDCDEALLLEQRPPAGTGIVLAVVILVVAWAVWQVLA